MKVAAALARHVAHLLIGGLELGGSMALVCRHGHGAGVHAVRRDNVVVQLDRSRQAAAIRRGAQHPDAQRLRIDRHDLAPMCGSEQRPRTLVAAAVHKQERRAMSTPMTMPAARAKEIQEALPNVLLRIANQLHDSVVERWKLWHEYRRGS